MAAAVAIWYGVATDLEAVHVFDVRDRVGKV